ncbi:MOSC domain-containing protein [Argonema galeatum]|uniref:MOSC domain-containing protein n=1 Tax=Argonema galeatum TaxID=2942762 RepID=UPI002013A649|nr:MOSC N-terminal beta barrel domain-containing protein [Argonema galeatum]MCL1463873.1 MOSC N-terminal beta barrel domain-containing protein [Argonema galeatum A003/A1]
MPYIAGIFIYPFKSLDAVAVTQATVLASGALEGDREFAIFDAQGRFVNGKRNAKVHLLRSTWDATAKAISLQIQGTEEKQTFHLETELTELEAWLSDYFGFTVQLARNSLLGFPDDPIASGPTVISTATLETVASWFPGISVDEMRLRLRANIEIGGVPPFWEDQLFANAEEVVRFQVGEVMLEGINPCQRCIVPTRNPLSGETYPNFQKVFSSKRQETLPSWVNLSRFNHFYRLSVNTKVSASSAGKVLHIQDEVGEISDFRFKIDEL